MAASPSAAIQGLARSRKQARVRFGWKRSSEIGPALRVRPRSSAGLAPATPRLDTAGPRGRRKQELAVNSTASATSTSRGRCRRRGLATATRMVARVCVKVPSCLQGRGSSAGRYQPLAAAAHRRRRRRNSPPQVTAAARAAALTVCCSSSCTAVAHSQSDTEPRESANRESQPASGREAAGSDPEADHQFRVRKQGKEGPQTLAHTFPTLASLALFRRLAACLLWAHWLAVNPSNSLDRSTGLSLRHVRKPRRERPLRRPSLVGRSPCRFR